MGRKILSLAGRRFGKLQVIEMRGRNLGGHVLWLCICDCGVVKEIPGGDINCGNVRSCGCSEGKIRHGHARHGKNSSEYGTWKAMKQRCLNLNNAGYADYGGRGIKVCERWLIFDNFIYDMGPRPRGLSLNRIDNDGDYTPDNCEWTDCGTQANNRRDYPKTRKSPTPRVLNNVQKGAKIYGQENREISAQG